MWYFAAHMHQAQTFLVFYLFIYFASVLATIPWEACNWQKIIALALIVMGGGNVFLCCSMSLKCDLRVYISHSYIVQINGMCADVLDGLQTANNFLRFCFVAWQWLMSLMLTQWQFCCFTKRMTCFVCFVQKKLHRCTSRKLPAMVPFFLSICY